MISAIALDLGTTSIKAGLLDQAGALSNIIALPAPPLTVNYGRYESDALAYAETADQVLGACLAQAGRTPPLGLCSRRSSFLIWEKSSGQPITPLISWQDNRGATSCEALRASESLIRDFTGLRLTPYYFAPKLHVVLQEHPKWRSKLECGEWLAGMLDTFLIWRWTGGEHHVTDASMAARTLLMDIRQQQWSPALCDLFAIPMCMLPRIKPSAGLVLRLDSGLTLQASLGDQSAALIASTSESSAEALVNLGTGGFVVRYLPEEKSTQDGYLRTLVYQDSKLQPHLAIEGTLNSITAALASYPAGECRIEDMAAEDIFALRSPVDLARRISAMTSGCAFRNRSNTLFHARLPPCCWRGLFSAWREYWKIFTVSMHSNAPIFRAAYPNWPACNKASHNVCLLRYFACSRRMPACRAPHCSRPEWRPHATGRLKKLK